MAELLQTERAFVKDLETCIKTYMDYNEINDVPNCIVGKQDTIFLNMKDIYSFHNE